MVRLVGCLQGARSHPANGRAGERVRFTGDGLKVLRGNKNNNNNAGSGTRTRMGHTLVDGAKKWAEPLGKDRRALAAFTAYL
jgi:hypothetical protein